MEIVLFFQNISSTFLCLVARIFSFFGSLPFFVFALVIFYWLIDKKLALKLLLTYVIGFVFGSLFLKNVFYRPRPYEVNPSIFANRYVYSGSFLSATTMLASEIGFGSWYEFTFKTKIKKFLKNLLLVVLITLCLLVGFSQIYFAQNYLLDILIGIGLGYFISFIVFKFFSLNEKKYIYILLILPLLFILLLFFVGQLFTNNFANSHIIEFIGLTSSLVISFYLENKYIKYQIKNNFIINLFKILIAILFLIGYFYLCALIFPGILIFSFFKYFVLGFTVFLFFPILFKKMDKYLFVFSKDVEIKNVKFSKIIFCENSTKKLAKSFSNKIQNGDVILLQGDLGAGKTVFARSILKNFGVKGKINSPTFTLVNEYKTSNAHLYHFDFYRLQDQNEVENLGFDEILEDKSSIKIIEWADKIKNYLPAKNKKITIVKLGNKTRNIILEEI